MSKKDKKVEIQVKDAKISLKNQQVDGYELLSGKKVIGSIVELDDRFAIVYKETVSEIHQTLDEAIQKVIADYNLNH